MERESLGELKRQAGDLAELADSPGWHDFLDFAKAELEHQRGKLETAIDMVDVHQRQGEIKALKKILAYQETQQELLTQKIANNRNS